MDKSESCTNDYLERMTLDELFGNEEEMEEEELINPAMKDSKAPQDWTIITALNRVLEKAKGSGLSDEFWDSCRSPLDFLKEQLGLTDIQLVALAIFIEMGEPVTWNAMGKFLHCSRLSVIVHSEEIEELLKKRWCQRRQVREFGSSSSGLVLVPGVTDALRHNRPFVPEKLDGLSIQEFMEKMVRHITKNENSHTALFSDDEEWLLQLCELNTHLPLCREALNNSRNIHELSLLMLIVVDYADWYGTENVGLHLRTIEEHYSDDDIVSDIMLDELRSGSLTFFRKGYIEHKCENGVANSTCYALTRKFLDELLVGYTPKVTKVPQKMMDGDPGIKKSNSIKEKTLFYNLSEQKQIERLTSLLQEENFKGVQERLEQQGMRKGFACLFYGGPGTGKTETVLQIARMTGRDIMQVDIAGMRDKYVGESEKNIKAVFSRYRQLCSESDMTPILFFNEADALINKRTTSIEHSVDKMDNAMQNIILQEIEDLDGILIATTNLTGNLDTAFERRFLFKVEFNKPEPEVKARIWSSMLSGISSEDASLLAKRFDFSGGQIENIARKRTIDFILNGVEPSFAQIEDYCKAELLDKKNCRRPVIGFSA